MLESPFRAARLVPLLVAVSLVGCFHDDDDDTPEFMVTVTPTISLNESGMAPLAASIALETDQPTRPILTVSDDDSTYTIEFVDFSTTHELPVLGLKSNRAYTIDVLLVDDRDRSLMLDTPLTIITDPLPDDIPVIEVLFSDPDRMEPGFTLLDRYFRDLPRQGPWPGGYTIIVDSAGDIVWYSELGGWPTIMEPDGNLLFRSDNEVFQVDLLGNEVSRIPLEYQGRLHHELQRSDHGTWLSLARDTVIVDDYPTSYTDPDAPTATTRILDENIIEFAADGSFLRQWPMTEIIHPQRVGYNSLDASYSGGPLDWIHANAVIDDPRDDDTFLISLRNQDAVVKFSRETGDIKWILGTHDNWPAEFQQYLLEPVGSPFTWFYHQHAPMYTPAGTVLLFDNGNFQTSPFSGIDPVVAWQSRSRGVEYEIDEQAMTVRQVWEFGGNGGETIFAPALGDADSLPITGNALLTYGFVTYTDGGASSGQGYSRVHSRIVEATRAASPERVFDIRLYPRDQSATVMVYRSERLPSLYSPDVAIIY